MPQPLQQLQDASARLRQSRRAVAGREGAAAPTAAPGGTTKKFPTHLDQLIAAGQSVVWVAAFVQHVYNSIADGDDSF